MSARRRDLERTSRDRLAADVREVEPGIGWRGPSRGDERRDGTGSPQVVDERGERLDRHDANAVDCRGLRGIAGRKRDLREACVAGGEREAESPANRPDGAIQAELSDEDATNLVGRFQARDLQEGDGHREVERSSELAEAGGREVDRDCAWRNRKPAVAQRRANPLSRLADARIRQADDRERGQSRGDVDLDVQNPGFDSDGRGGVDSGEHDASSAEERRIAR